MTIQQVSEAQHWADAAAGRAEALRLADRVAQGGVDAAAPLRFETADTDATRDAVYRLRCEVVVARGWAQPAGFPDGRESDDYDPLAIHIAAWDGARLAATSRMVLPAPGLILPTERAFQVVLEPAGQVVDMGRQIVHGDYSGNQHLVFAALLGKTWLELRARGFVWVGGDFTPAVTRLYRLMGFQVRQVGPGRIYWGEERFPVVVDVPASVPALLKRWGRLVGGALDVQPDPGR
jgi:hypothetical protein